MGKQNGQIAEIDRAQRKIEARKLREGKAVTDQKLRGEQQRLREESDRRRAERKTRNAKERKRRATATRQAMRIAEMAKLDREPLVPREDKEPIGNYILGFLATIFLGIGLLALGPNSIVGAMLIISGLLLWIIVILEALRKGIYRVLRELQFARMSRTPSEPPPDQTVPRSEPPPSPANFRAIDGSERS